MTAVMLAQVADREFGIGIYSSIVFGEAVGNNGPFSYAVTGSPPGMTYTSSNRTLAGRPSRKGAYTVRFTATDSNSDTGYVEFTITVSGIDSLVLHNYRLQLCLDNTGNFTNEQVVTRSFTGVVAGLRLTRTSQDSVVWEAGDDGAGVDGVGNADVEIEAGLSIGRIEWRSWQSNPLTITRSAGDSVAFDTAARSGGSLSGKSLYLTAPNHQTVELRVSDAVTADEEAGYGPNITDDAISWPWRSMSDGERRTLGFVMDMASSGMVDVRIADSGGSIVVGNSNSNVIDVWDDIVEEFSVERGRDFKLGYSIALASRVSVILRNDHRTYTPYVDDRNLRPEARLQMQIGQTGDWLTLWRGVVDDVKEITDKPGYTLVEFKMLGIISNLVNTRISTSMQLDMEIEDLFEASLEVAELADRWIGDIESTRRIARWWILDEEILDVLGVLERTEYGTFFENREGNLTLQPSDFRDNAARRQNAIVFSDEKTDRMSGSFDIVEASYEIPRWNVVNAVKVRIRKYNTSVEAVLWELEDAIEIEANETISLVVEHGAGVAVWSTPVRGTDYEASTTSTGTADRNNDVTVSIQAGGGDLQISVENTSGTDLYLIKLDLKGRALTEENSYFVEEKDQDSIDEYGLRTNPAPETWHSDYTTARTYAREFLRVLAGPQKRVKIRYNINNHRADSLARLDVSDVVNIHWEGVQQNMFVESVNHYFSRGNRHDMELVCSTTEFYGTTLVFDDPEHGIIGTNTFGR